MKYNKELIKKFLVMYFFILKAASDGWSVRYIGGNQFTFLKGKQDKQNFIPLKTKDFIDNFHYKL